MKKLFLCILALVFIVGFLIHPGCKIVEEVEAPNQYTLLVKHGDGVSGVPADGTYNYNENQTVTYSYTATAGYEGLDVALDGITIANSGFISMDSNHTLDVTAVFDLTGEWSGWHAEGPNGEGIHFRITLTFSGGGSTGTITGNAGAGSDWPFTGTYNLNGSVMEFELDGGALTYPKFTGTIDDINNMTGTYSSYPGETGIWVLARQ